MGAEIKGVDQWNATDRPTVDGRDRIEIRDSKTRTVTATTVAEFLKDAQYDRYGSVADRMALLGAGPWLTSGRLRSGLPIASSLSLYAKELQADYEERHPERFLREQVTALLRSYEQQLNEWPFGPHENVPDDCDRCTPIVRAMLKSASEVIAVGLIPDREELSQYPGANEEERAANWAKCCAVDRYLEELGRLYPVMTANEAVKSVLGLIAVNGKRHVSYQNPGGKTVNLNVTNLQAVFLGRLLRENPLGIRTAFEWDGFPNLSDEQYREVADDLISN
ncbi:MAG TPA: hypothetical protein VFX30_07210 [bacterium]|nr:hypothetical protein [bacterium]